MSGQGGGGEHGVSEGGVGEGGVGEGGVGEGGVGEGGVGEGGVDDGGGGLGGGGKGAAPGRTETVGGSTLSTVTPRAEDRSEGSLARACTEATTPTASPTT